MERIENGRMSHQLVETDEDLDLYLEFGNRMFPEHAATLEETKKFDALTPADKFFGRRLVWVDGVLRGGVRLAEAFWKEGDGLFSAGLRWGLEQEVGELRLAVRMAEDWARAEGGRELDFWEADRYPAMLEALTAEGYERGQENPESGLELGGFDRSEYEGVFRSVAESGIRLVPLSEAEGVLGPEFLRLAWQADWELTQDVPVPWEKKQDPFELYERHMEAERKNWPTILLALDGSAIVGTSMLFRNMADPGIYSTGLTGVMRAYRRRGIATALKVENLVRAQGAGGRLVVCDNEEKNPMLQLNHQLGFRTIYRSVHFVKRWE